ncbi:hypothetical protein ACFORH_43125 [Amycolatopsis roodepoortensis]|uniref:Uncharacterized protein n=1 Tax=Amycolatopsis roodepoortensis TaxID=700274 RepID=A0ABR9LK59_9PSEU|nr:hypothetical protein [Amycolatopsis roodepoortensis]MBE1580466.1 hypothetical protein [Amycolatopsis roodepoortensis]
MIPALAFIGAVAFAVLGVVALLLARQMYRAAIAATPAEDDSPVLGDAPTQPLDLPRQPILERTSHA